MTFYRIISDEDGHKYICPEDSLPKVREAESEWEEAQESFNDRKITSEEMWQAEAKLWRTYDGLERAEGDLWDDYVMVRRSDVEG